MEKIKNMVSKLFGYRKEKEELINFLNGSKIGWFSNEIDIIEVIDQEIENLKSKNFNYQTSFALKFYNKFKGLHNVNKKELEEIRRFINKYGYYHINEKVGENVPENRREKLHFSISKCAYSLYVQNRIEILCSNTKYDGLRKLIEILNANNIPYEYQSSSLIHLESSYEKLFKISKENLITFISKLKEIFKDNNDISTWCKKAIECIKNNKNNNKILDFCKALYSLYDIETDSEIRRCKNEIETEIKKRFEDEFNIKKQGDFVKKDENTESKTINRTKERLRIIAEAKKSKEHFNQLLGTIKTWFSNNQRFFLEDINEASLEIRKKLQNEGVSDKDIEYYIEFYREEYYKQDHSDLNYQRAMEKYASIKDTLLNMIYKFNLKNTAVEILKKELNDYNLSDEQRKEFIDDLSEELNKKTNNYR